MLSNYIHAVGTNFLVFIISGLVFAKAFFYLFGLVLLAKDEKDRDDKKDHDSQG